MSDTLAVGRIGWWRFQNGDLTDQSGNGRDLVCVGTQVNASDKDGIANNAVNLYTGGYYKTNDTINPLSGLGAWSFNIWLNIKPYVSNEGWLSLGDTEYVLYNDGGDFAYAVPPSTSILFQRNLGWRMFTFIFDNGNVGVYENNVLKGSSSARPTINSTVNDLLIGRRTSYLTSRKPNADFDEISMYNRALTADERAELLARGVNYTPDTTPPSFNSVNIDTITYNSANLNVNLNEDGKVYYQLLARNATPPTSAEVKANPENIINVTANTTSIFPITSLDVNTNFDLYVVAEDNIPNLQLEPTKIQFATLSNEELTIDSYISEIQQNYGKFKVSSNKNATIYYMLSIKGTYNSPSPTDIVADQTGNQYCIKDIQYEISFITSENTSYDLFIVAKDDLDNYSDVIKHTFRTPFDNSSYKKIFKKIHNFKISDKIHLISTKEMYYQILSESEFALQNYDINNSSINKYISPIKISDIGNKILYIVEYDNDNYTISDIQRIYPLQIENKINSSHTFNKQ